MSEIKTANVTAPSQKTIADTKQLLAVATLQDIATVTANASATLNRLKGTADAIKGSLTTAVLRVVSKEKIGDVAAPVRDTLAAAGGRVPNLSTIRAAVCKMATAYGAASALPHWGSVAEAKESGDAAFSALAASCFVDVDGVLTLDAQKRVDAETRLVTACTLMGIADNAVGKWKTDLAAAVQALGEQAEQAAEQAAADAAQSEQDAEDAQILADAAAQQAAELETLRAIAEQAARIFGIEDRGALLAEMTVTDAA